MGALSKLQVRTRVQGCTLDCRSQRWCLPRSVTGDTVSPRWTALVLHVRAGALCARPVATRPLRLCTPQVPIKLTLAESDIVSSAPVKPVYVSFGTAGSGAWQHGRPPWLHANCACPVSELMELSPARPALYYCMRQPTIALASHV
jgi:hypothetical protein